MTQDEQCVQELIMKAQAGDEEALEILAERYKHIVLTISEALLEELGKEGDRKETLMAALSALYSLIMTAPTSSEDDFVLLLNSSKSTEYAREAHNNIVAYHDIPHKVLCAKAQEGDEVAQMILAFQDVTFPPDGSEPLFKEYVEPKSKRSLPRTVGMLVGNVLTALKPSMPVLEGDGSMYIHVPFTLQNKNKGRNN